MRIAKLRLLKALQKMRLVSRKATLTVLFFWPEHFHQEIYFQQLVIPSTGSEYIGTHFCIIKSKNKGSFLDNGG